jgi:HlyD family secretion protein
MNMIDRATRRALTGLLMALALTGCSEAPPSAWAGYAEGDYIYLAAPIGGRLDQLSVQVGDLVGRGYTLFALDAQAELAARDEARARLAAADAQAADTTKGRRSDELAVTHAQLAQAQASAALAQTAWQRQRELVAQGFISPAGQDQARATLDQARARVAELQASLRVAALPARSDARSAAQAQAQAQTGVVRQAEWRLAQKQQQAPALAHVTEVFFRVGEYVMPGQPVLALLPPGGTKARFYVREDEVASLALGQWVSLSCDGCGEPVPARISRIATGPEFTPPVIYSNAQRAKLVFLVEARPSPADGARLHPGQPMDVVRRVGEAK